MSSETGLRNPETGFLAPWMPCSSRAGVILSPPVDLARSLSSDSWAHQNVDDSFSAQFTPLPYSSTCSSLSVEYVAPDEMAVAPVKSDQRSAADSAGLQHASAGTVIQEFTGQMGNMVESPGQPPEDLMLKLQQLKHWQLRMQDELKAQQMRQLQELLDEQQRLLGLVYDTQNAGAGDFGGSQLRGGDWEEDAAAAGPPASPGERRPSLSSVPDLQGPPALKRSPVPLQLPISPPLRSPSNPCVQSITADLHPPAEEEEGEDAFESLGSDVQRWRGDLLRDEDDEDGEEGDSRYGDASRCDDSPQAANGKGTDPTDLQDRPIRPGIAGRSRTFEELLEEQLQMEEQRLNSGPQKQGPAGAEEVRANPKRPFLRRGQGLSRFMGGKALVSLQGGKAVPRSQAKPASTQGAAESGRANDRQRPPVQRKTTVLGREPALESAFVPPTRRKTETQETRPPRADGQPRPLPGPQKPNTVVIDRGPSAWSGAKQSLRQREAPPSTKPSSQQGPAGVRAESSGQGSQVRADGVEAGGGAGRVGPGRDPSMERSLQAKPESWEMEQQREQVELGEFELLEQAAEEMSFSSNSSFVMKVLELDRQDPRGRHLPWKHRRLSSTPIKSPKPSPPKMAQSSDVAPDRLCLANDATDGGPVGESGEGGATVPSDPSESESEDAEDEPGQEVRQHVPALLSNPCFSPSHGQYDKMSYQDRETDLCRGDDPDNSGGFSDHNDSTLKEGRGLTDGRLVFDDDDTWNDSGEAMEGGVDDDVGASTDDHLGAESGDRALKRKVASAKGPERAPLPNPACRKVDPPPTAQLVAKLFPSLKPKPQPAPPTNSAPTGTSEDPAAGRQSRLLRERLAELEIEIERFRSENATLASQRQEREKALEALRKERAEFERVKEEELARLEEFKREETRKLQKERKVFEKHASAARAIPDKREREEIQALKQQLSSLQEELSRRETRWSNTHNRLRQQVETLGEENAALREEVRTLERLRLSAWKSAEAERESERERERERGQEGCSRPGGGAAARSKSTSPPGALRASQPFTATSREAHLGTSTAKGTKRSSSTSSRKSPRGPAPISGAQEQAVPDQEQPITAQGPKTPPALLAGAGVSRAESCAEEEEPSRREITHPDGKIETVLPCGTRLIVFPNGTRKEVSADGRTVKVNFFNGDVKQVLEDQRVIYYYANTQTTHTTYPDGMEVLQFPNNQIEKHFPDGRKEITFPDQTTKTLSPNGDEESVLPDGTIIQLKSDGTKVIQFTSGQREIHTDQFKRREYPDGTVKTVYSDGRQETRYPTGRLRIKDKDGRVVMDART